MPPMTGRITGERVSGPTGGFHPTWQRHVAAYDLVATEFGPGRLLDLGCGVGHSFDRLAPRETVGLDLSPEALAGQDRETVVSDMREIPFPDGSFDSVLSVHSVEHVTDPERVVAEAARVLRPAGTAVFVTPNRLTFGRPDEIIDPFHFIEFSAPELETLCRTGFSEVEITGLFGSSSYMELHDEERAKLDRMLALDPLRLRRLIPVRARQGLYDMALRRFRREADPRAGTIGVEDFHRGQEDLDRCLDVIAVCRVPG